MAMPYITRRQPVMLRSGTTASVHLELEFFSALRFIATIQGISMSELIRRIEAEPCFDRQPLPSRLRCYAIKWMMDQLFWPAQR